MSGQGRMGGFRFAEKWNGCQMGTLPLATEDYRRYGRQMILDGFGLSGQIKLQNSSIAVIGAGGLGCPALQYLAASGVGRLGIFDADVVDLSNLHRQILYSEQDIGMPKARSAAQALLLLNSRLKVDVVVDNVTAANAQSLLAPYDLLLDCTDNAPTRYLLSDTAVSLGKPLVSGAAQMFEGQLCVYNFGSTGPCYRCLYPVPPGRESITSCAETGVLGVVTGIIGTMQAAEAVKIITNLHEYKPSLLLFSLREITPFRSIKLRSRKPTCFCGSIPKFGNITEFDYVQFCGGQVCDLVQHGLIEGQPGARATVKELESAMRSSAPYKIIDVRPSVEFEICHISGSTNMPLKELTANPAHCIAGCDGMDIYLICRLGNDSQVAANALLAHSAGFIVKDVIGGLRAWTNEIDPSFPVY